MKRRRDQGSRIDVPTPTKESIESQTSDFIRLTKDSDFDEATMTKVITWNVNGLRAISQSKKDFMELFTKEKPDIVCLQETKLSRDVKNIDSMGEVEGYSHYDCIGLKKGYSGTRVYVKKSIHHSVLGYTLDFTTDESSSSTIDDEGRVIIIEFDSIVVVNTYVPNAGDGLKRVDYRVKEWDRKMEGCLQRINTYLTGTGKNKNVIWTGDLNVAERDYDRYFQKSYTEMGKCAGFSPMERDSFRQILQKNDMVDAFRALYPTAAPVYSFWSYRILGRKNNMGWRLDYFVLQKSLMKLVADCFMLPSVLGSDHCPCVLWLKSRV
ncbi:apurinic/apyrimidinic endonuclease [Perkinsela sp. CCAP 1560/4]|nr:apurinic/apyrimidinic endonuclease [Perkinsela sp. CCAP 1560/4]|eukprot:KNH07584.1 apurinic/apyrimidinic endonuclease [Perkinsela sp. CCAP 1560/4]